MKCKKEERKLLFLFPAGIPMVNVDQLEFGGESPLTMRAFGAPAIVPTLGLARFGTADLIDQLKFGGESPLTMRYRLRWANGILWASRPGACFRSAYGIR